MTSGQGRIDVNKPSFMQKTFYIRYNKWSLILNEKLTDYFYLYISLLF